MMATMAYEIVDSEQQNELDARWRAVEMRDRRFDGVFVYAVVSTGIYCRPSCPSRRPAPKNVRFFDVNAEAEAAGFRACLRCKPNAQPTESETDAAVGRARQYLEAHDDVVV